MMAVTELRFRQTETDSLRQRGDEHGDGNAPTALRRRETACWRECETPAEEHLLCLESTTAGVPLPACRLMLPLNGAPVSMR